MGATAGGAPLTTAAIGFVEDKDRRGGQSFVRVDGGVVRQLGGAAGVRREQGGSVSQGTQPDLSEGQAKLTRCGYQTIPFCLRMLVVDRRQTT
jgi:hypothetical protein